MGKRICLVEGCDKPCKSRGLCGMHYSRWYRAHYPERVRASNLAYEGKNRDEVNARHAAWKAKNRERYNQKQRAYYRKNLELIRDRRRAWREANREQIRDYQRAWREANREQIRAYWFKDHASKLAALRDYRAANRGALNLKSREYYERNWERFQHERRRRYEAAKAAGRCAWMSGRGCQQDAVPGFVLCSAHRAEANTRRTAREQRIYDHSYRLRGLSACWMCGGDFTDTDPRNHDHLIPRSLGGPDEPWNYAPAHRSCNIQRSNLPLAETVERWHPTGIADPSVRAAVGAALARDAADAA